MSVKLALAMIVKDAPDEAVHLQKCLLSLDLNVDKIFLYVNGQSKEPSKMMVRALKELEGVGRVEWSYGKWTNFGDARNKSFTMVPKDYDFILWLDADDTLENPEKLRQVALATPNHIDGIYMPYEYQHDEFGNVTVEHYVARLVRNNGTYKWSDKILHESLEPVRHSGKALNQEVRVIHHADNERRDRSLQRNIEMLEKELKGEGDHPDARTLYYLGSAYIDAGRLDEAKELLETYLRLSGWAEERSQAWTHLGNIYETEQNLGEMKKCYLHALNENPKDPSVYVSLGKVEMRSGMYGKAAEWLRMGLSKKPDPMTTVNNSMETTYRLHMLLAECYLNEGGRFLDKALKHAHKALEMRPDDQTREYYESVEKLIKHRDMATGVVAAIKELENTQKDRIPPLIQNLPECLQDNPAILRFKKRHTPPKKWGEKSVVIFCGNSILGEWGPWSLEEGIGGSEEAVIRLSKQLTNQGWRVTVYSTPGARVGDYDGVSWRNYWELNLGDTFDVFIAWRSPWFFDVPIKARKKYLWLHDVMEKEEFTPERLDNLDKVIVLSKYHRSLYPMIPDDKIFLSTNGIDPEDFNIKAGKRDTHRIIYMSSHVRGLQLLYEIWDDVKKAVPKATLDIYYGWESFVNVNRSNPERMNWMQMMVDWEKELDGVTDHGKISQPQIVEEILKSGVWAYPCPFPEISCITAMKAQAGGAIPVSSDFAALEETVQWGKKIHMKPMDENTPVGKWNKKDLSAFKDALIETLTSPQKRDEMMKWSRENQSWSKVAEGWMDEFQG